ncbi:MAG: hypothetical protein GY719_39160 [bacterium]|nr:hypothetical protein [bacterium]
MNEIELAAARAEGRRAECRHTECRRTECRGGRRRRTVLATLAIAALALPWTGCVPMLLLRDARCHGFDVGDPLLEIHFAVVTEPLRPGVVTPRPPESLYLLVGQHGEAAMVHTPKDRMLLRSRCRALAADDLAAVVRAVERLERSVVAERRVVRPGCRDFASIVLRGDRQLESFSYCDTTPPAAILRFVEEISAPLGRRFGKELATGLAAAAPWAPPVLLDQPGPDRVRGRDAGRAPRQKPRENRKTR